MLSNSSKFVPNKLTYCIALAVSSALYAESSPVILNEVEVVAAEISDTIVNTSTNQAQLQQRQAKDIKDVFHEKMDVYGTQAQMTRASEGVNIRGLQGNRVTSTVDGIPLAETQEAKHFMAFGSEFGRGDYVEVSGLRRADVQYAGSANSLSGSVNFSTLKPSDLLKGKSYGGFIGTGYHSIDNSIYTTLGGAVEAGHYQGMVMTTFREGDQTINQGTGKGTGSLRTEPNPSEHSSQYILTKHGYKFNEQHQLLFTFEHLAKNVESNLLAQTDTSIDARTGIQRYGTTFDKVNRQRFSLGHEYQNDKGWLQTAKTQIYLQNSETNNYRFRQGMANHRLENANIDYRTFGLNSDLMSYIDGSIPQAIRYGFSYNRTDASGYLRYERPAYIGQASGQAYFNGKPSADTTQDKFTAYLEDEIAFGNLYLTPQLGLVHYRVKPTHAEPSRVSEFTPTKRRETQFTPKLSLEWRASEYFSPYVQYSRGVRTPSAQQLTSYFFENPIISLPNGRSLSTTIAVLGNPNLKSEKADNFEVGVKGKSAEIDYLLTGYYNRYHHFIDWQANPQLGCMRGCKYTSFVQYENLDKAKVYGLTFDAKWKFHQDYYLLAGLSYARGKAENNGVKTPINSVQPLKTKLGFGYEGERFGANIAWHFTRAKADKDIEQSSTYLYNPSNSYGLVDLGVYFKPVKNLTINAGVNNVFDKKYWNWNDISYLALLSKASVDQGRGANGIPLAITEGNADRYSAPGRNFSLGVRYEF